ncbi:TonB-dependent receptor plug domain-containing protein [Helicobacter canis]|uniref:TonB-dependent receptor plug domain-containing protein n=1 Tax=Helicobacter canis TaxID=29419 RepID=UPI0029436804|nr:TonB-dependent receptor plug domain-containing protein [Helicobacter canis]
MRLQTLLAMLTLLPFATNASQASSVSSVESSAQELDSTPESKLESSLDSSPKSLPPVYTTATRTPVQSEQILAAKDALLHSGDIAKSLLYVPGFSMVRKGGLGAEVLLRSQGASRVPILLDGGNLQGACGGRMDTSATYIFPENYDHILLIKGPQDVRWGSLISGGAVFMRDITMLDHNTLQADTSMLAGSFDRLDLHASMLAGGKYGSLRAIASHYESGDYRTGSASFSGGSATHSAYKRESASLIATLTPTKYTGIELDMDIGRGFSSYQDRQMDARTFDRLSFSLKAQQQFQSEIVRQLDLRASWHEVDHIMDNFSHRQASGDYQLNNPKRTNANARAELTLYPSQALTLYLGASYAYDDHQMRTSGKQSSANAANAFLSQAYKPNFHFNYASIFMQGSYAQLDSASSVYFGARYDYASAHKASSAESSSNHLGSGFARYQYERGGFSYFIGLGLAQRSPDFWERSKVGGMGLEKESNLQLDAATAYKRENLSLQASLYGAYMWDYIALHYDTNTASAFNTNALLAGAELEAKYGAFGLVYISGSLAYTYGQNLTTRSGLLAGSPLPQVAPLQAQVSLWLEHRGFLVRADMFANAAQSRYAKDYGNVIGKDFGASLGFATLSIYGGYKRKNFSLLCGVENLTNALYGYHLSKAGVMVGELAPTSRIYEPGRSYYLKLALGF